MSLQRPTIITIAFVLLLGVTPSTGAAAQSSGDGARGGLMLVLDASGSMAADAGDGTTRIDAARQALTQVVQALPDDVPVGLTVYGHTVGNDESLAEEGCRDIETVAPVAPLDRPALERAIASFQPSGWTPLGGALEHAAEELAAVEGPKTVVLVSDGEDTCAPPDPCAVAARLAERGIDLRVETIGFQVDEAARDQLECIAQATGGSYRDAPDARSLTDSLETLSLRAFRHYEPSGEPITGGLAASEATPIEPGQYLDTITDLQSRWYRFDLAPGEAFEFAAVFIPTRDSPNVAGPYEIKWYDDPAEDWCHKESQPNVGRTVLARAVAGPADRGRCSTAETVWIEVHLGSDDLRHDFDLEVRFDRFDAQRPEPALGAGHAGPQPGTADDPAPVVGAGGFNDAPVIEPGVYRDNIRGYEDLVYAVDLGVGQLLDVTVETTSPSSIDDPGVLDLRVYSPGLVSHPSQDRDRVEIRDPDEPLRLRFQTEEIGPDAFYSTYRRPGRYYITLELYNGLDTSLLDFTMDVTVAGDVIAPTASPSSTAAPSATASSAPASQPTETATERPVAPGSGGTPGWLWLLSGLVLGGAVVAGVRLRQSPGRATGRTGREDGSVAPALMLMMFALAAAGFFYMKHAGAAALTAEATSAADAAALAAAQAVKDELGLVEAALLAVTEELPPDVQEAAEGRAHEYAGRNGGSITGLRLDVEHRSIRATVEATTARDLDGGRPDRVAVAEVEFQIVQPGGGPRCMSMDAVRDLAASVGLPEPADSGLSACDGPNTYALHPEIKVAVLEVEHAMGSNVVFNSAYRTIEEQAYLHHRCLVYGECPAAPPGASLHNYGLAFDASNHVAIRAALDENPDIDLCQPMPVDDAVHFSHAGYHECGGPNVLPPIGAIGASLDFSEVRLVR